VTARALGLLLGWCADLLLADPERHHPVAWFGSSAHRLEQRVWRDDARAGAAYAAVLVAGVVAPAVLVERRGGPVVRTLTTATATWVALGGTSLDREAAAVQARLESGDLAGARRQVARIVGRETAGLDEAGVARAAVESVAENTSDAVVGTLVWGAALGLPGLLGHRAANTLDAMVGHRTVRHERFGWAAARLDDLLGLPAARLTASLAVVLGEDPRAAARAWRRVAGAHPSPNAGPVEAAFAGALGLSLGGPTTYGTRTEPRPRLGDGRAPGPVDLARARRLARRVGAGALVISVLLAAAPRPARR
jgi:adenosylcobinamide-phosphate synthase